MCSVFGTRVIFYYIYYLANKRNILRKIMTGKEVKLLFLMLILMTAAFTTQSFVLFHNQEEMKNKQLTLEQSHEEELDSIYQLLAAAAFTQRTNMNLSVKTNHYLTHPKGQHGEKPNLTCEECWKGFEQLVKNMPPMPGGNGVYWDHFYKQPYEKLKKMREEQTQ